MARLTKQRMRALVDRQINGGVKFAGSVRHDRRERHDDRRGRRARDRPDNRSRARTRESDCRRRQQFDRLGNRVFEARARSRRGRGLASRALVQQADAGRSVRALSRDCRSGSDTADHALQRAGPHFVEHRRADDAAAGARLRKHRRG